MGGAPVLRSILGYAVRVWAGGEQGSPGRTGSGALCTFLTFTSSPPLMVKPKAVGKHLRPPPPTASSLLPNAHPQTRPQLKFQSKFQPCCIIQSTKQCGCIWRPGGGQWRAWPKVFYVCRAPRTQRRRPLCPDHVVSFRNELQSE